MRDILATCVELDTLAATTYRSLSQHCTDADLAAVFDQLALEEEAHVGWWQELLDAWDQGLIPDVINDPESLLEDLRQVRDDVATSLPDDLSALTARHRWSRLPHTSSSSCSIPSLRNCSN
jgi:rubrerythrin